MIVRADGREVEVVLSHVSGYKHVALVASHPDAQTASLHAEAIRKALALTWRDFLPPAKPAPALIGRKLDGS